jgi:16S rRNA (cytosine1402-N4)-methyltransferase
LEDRLVKREFQNRMLWAPISKKPLIASPEEQAKNPRSRSAKLRVARRLLPGEGGDA